MKYLFIVLSLLLMAQQSIAQGLPSKTTLFQAPGDVEPIPTEAVYRVERTEVAGKTRLDSVYYVASKRLLRVEASQRQPNGDTLTTTTTWRANGKLFNKSQRVGTKLQGDYITYNSQGNIQQKAVYDKGRVVSTECFSETGGPTACPAYTYTEKMPVFPGSQQAFLNYIGSSIRYPKAARKNRQQGVVQVNFVVDETGAVRNVHIHKGLSPEIDAEAVRVVKTVSGFQAGEQNGEKVPVSFTLPVTFAIR